MFQPLLLPALLLFALTFAKPATLSSRLYLPSNHSAPSPTITTDLTCWRPVDWRIRIARDFYIVFTGYSPPLPADERTKILDSFQQLIGFIDLHGRSFDPIEFDGRRFGELSVFVSPYKEKPPPARASFAVVIAVVMDLMRRCGARLFFSKLEFGRVKVASFGIGWADDAAGAVAFV